MSPSAAVRLGVPLATALSTPVPLVAGHGAVPPPPSKRRRAHDGARPGRPSPKGERSRRRGDSQFCGGAPWRHSLIRTEDERDRIVGESQSLLRLFSRNSSCSGRVAAPCQPAPSVSLSVGHVGGGTPSHQRRPDSQSHKSDLCTGVAAAARAAALAARSGGRHQRPSRAAAASGVGRWERSLTIFRD